MTLLFVRPSPSRPEIIIDDLALNGAIGYGAMKVSSPVEGQKVFFVGNVYKCEQAFAMEKLDLVITTDLIDHHSNTVYRVTDGSPNMEVLSCAEVDKGKFKYFWCPIVAQNVDLNGDASYPMKKTLHLMDHFSDKLVIKDLETYFLDLWLQKDARRHEQPYFASYKYDFKGEHWKRESIPLAEVIARVFKWHEKEVPQKTLETKK